MPVALGLPITGFDAPSCRLYRLAVMSAPLKLSPSAPAAESAEGRRPRALVIAEAWRELGPGVAALSNGSGRPLARTLKLILDPLVIRPVQNPGLAGGTLTSDAAAELHDRIRAAGGDLTAAAAWFLELKAARRRLRITDGNPQEKYFQRCFELARTSGPPSADADAVAAEVVTEIAEASGDSLLAQVRELLRDETAATRLGEELGDAWARRPGPGPAAASASESAETVAAALDACPTGDGSAPLSLLVDGSAGSTAGARLADDGAAQQLGLTRHLLPPAPRLGETASKRDLPLPFDRSIFERLFAALSGGARVDLGIDAEELIVAEIVRSTSAWQLGEEDSRVAMLLGAEASTALDAGRGAQPTAAHRLLAARWHREAYVRRALRLPEGTSGVPASVVDDIRTVRRGYLRRLWVRLHGRELREQPLDPRDVWDLLDGVLRSVVMDQRQRLKTMMVRGADEREATEAA